MVEILKLLAGPLVGLFKDWWGNRQQTKSLKHGLKVAKLKAQAAHIKRDDLAQTDWNTASINQAGWRDEWMTIILSVPLVLCFVPQTAPFIVHGFDVLRATPDWYQGVVLAMIASAFGLQKIVKWRNK